jgi:hypothetical protein
VDVRRISEDVRELGWDLLAAVLVNSVFLGLGALVLWAMGKAGLAGRLGMGLLLFTVVVALSGWVSGIVQNLLRIESDPPSNAYLLMNVAVSGVLQLGWAWYAALAATRFAAGASPGIAVGVHAVGALSSFLSGTVVGAFYRGHLYKMINALLSIAGYGVFAVIARSEVLAASPLCSLCSLW